MGPAMEPYRLKVKVGAHEFEAEGTPEDVRAQFEMWRELIAMSGVATPPAPPPGAAGSAPGQPAPDSRADFDRLFRHDGRVVSLTMAPDRAEDALLLLLLGQKVYNSDDLVTGSQLQDGLKITGLPMDRVDRGWGEHLGSNVVRIGQRRAVRYRLTNPGDRRAREIAKELLARLP